MKKELEDMLLSLARPIALFHNDLTRNGVLPAEATKITLEVFGFSRRATEEKGSPVIEVGEIIVKH